MLDDFAKFSPKAYPRGHGPPSVTVDRKFSKNKKINKIKVFSTVNYKNYKPKQLLPPTPQVCFRIRFWFPQNYFSPPKFGLKISRNNSKFPRFCSNLWTFSVHYVQNFREICLTISQNCLKITSKQVFQIFS